MKEKIKNIFRNIAFKKIFITLVLRVIGVIVLFGITILMTRNFPANEVGDYDFSRTLLLLLGSIALLGTDQSILYFSGVLQSKKNFHNIKKIYQKILLFILLLCLAINLIFFLLPTNWFKEDTYMFLKKGILMLFFYSVTIFNTEYLRAINYIYLSELFRNTFKYIPLFVGCILLINFDIDYSLVDFFYFGFFVLAIVTSIFCIVYNARLKNTSKAEIFRINNKHLINKSLPMLLSSILIFTNLSIDVFLLKKYYTSADIAYYSTVMKLITILSMVIISFNINISTLVAELYNVNKLEELQLLIKKNTKLVFSLNLLIAITLTIIGIPLLEFFGNGYSKAYVSLIILLFSQVLSSYLCTAPIILNMIGKSNIYFKILLVSTLICVITNSLLIPYLGINGAAISFLITNLFSYFTIYLYVKRKYKLSISII